MVEDSSISKEGQESSVPVEQGVSEPKKDARLGSPIIPQSFIDDLTQFNTDFKAGEEARKKKLEKEEAKIKQTRAKDDIYRIRKINAEIDEEIESLAKRLNELKARRSANDEKIRETENSLPQVSDEKFDDAPDEYDVRAKANKKTISIYLNSDDLDVAFAAAGVNVGLSWLTSKDPEHDVDFAIQKAEEIAKRMRGNYDLLTTHKDEPFISWVDNEFQATTGRIPEVKRGMQPMYRKPELHLVADRDNEFTQVGKSGRKYNRSELSLDAYSGVLGSVEDVEQFFANPNSFEEGRNHVVAVGLDASKAFGDRLTRRLNAAFDRRGSGHFGEYRHVRPSQATQNVMGLFTPESIESI